MSRESHSLQSLAARKLVHQSGQSYQAGMYKPFVMWKVFLLDPAQCYSYIGSLVSLPVLVTAIHLQPVPSARVGL
jgi:hypothetical protein